jgi:hypothetical protein
MKEDRSAWVSNVKLSVHKVRIASRTPSISPMTCVGEVEFLFQMENIMQLWYNLAENCRIFGRKLMGI